MSHSHGAKLDVVAPRSKFYQGPFGRLCPDLPPWSPGVPDHKLDEFFLKFANEHMIEVPGATPGDLDDGGKEEELEQKFGTGDPGDPSTGIPAGYTYFGQFVDHDITFDPASSLMRRNDPNGLLNFRTPRLDLDNIYGRGPDDQPYLYEHDESGAKTGRMLIGQVRGSGLRDLPRNGEGRALIGDMRNDENSIVSQLQLAFLLAHNTLVDRAKAKGHADPFESARKSLRWLYQWVVWNDFIARIASDEVYKCALRQERTCDGRLIWECGLDDVYSWKHQPFMPVEFSVAAYRFGHSMVRNAYRTNFEHRALDFTPIFDNSGAADPDDLRGFRPMTNANSIQWDWFLHMTSSSGPFPQRARKIDTKLANALAFLHEGGGFANVLPARNLKRGVTFGLPSGTDMAKKLCIRPVALKDGEPDALWYYILKEAETLPGKNGGQMLGRLGSIIVCAVFAGLLKGDPCSYFNTDPCWTPDDDELLCPGVDNVDGKDGAWGLPAIIRIAGAPIDGGDVGDQTGGDFPDTVSCVKS